MFQSFFNTGWKSKNSETRKKSIIKITDLSKLKQFTEFETDEENLIIAFGKIDDISVLQNAMYNQKFSEKVRSAIIPRLGNSAAFQVLVYYYGNAWENTLIQNLLDVIDNSFLEKELKRKPDHLSTELRKILIKKIYSLESDDTAELLSKITDQTHLLELLNGMTNNKLKSACNKLPDDLVCKIYTSCRNPLKIYSSERIASFSDEMIVQLLTESPGITQRLIDDLVVKGIASRLVCLVNKKDLFFGLFDKCWNRNQLDSVLSQIDNPAILGRLMVFCDSNEQKMVNSYLLKNADLFEKALTVASEPPFHWENKSSILYGILTGQEISIQNVLPVFHLFANATWWHQKNDRVSTVKQNLLQMRHEAKSYLKTKNKVDKNYNSVRYFFFRDHSADLLELLNSISDISEKKVFVRNCDTGLETSHFLRSIPTMLQFELIKEHVDCILGSWGKNRFGCLKGSPFSTLTGKFDWKLSVQVLKKESCPDCDGRGELRCDSYDPQACDTCNGIGYFEMLELVYSKDNFKFIVSNESCRSDDAQFKTSVS